VETRHDLLLWLWDTCHTISYQYHCTGTLTTAVALGHASQHFISISLHWNMNYRCGSGTRVTPFHMSITALEHELRTWLWDTCHTISYQYHCTGTLTTAVALGHVLHHFISVSLHWNMTYCCGSGTRVTPFRINITSLEHELHMWLRDTCHSIHISITALEYDLLL
jgi:hypothetical protein